MPGIPGPLPGENTRRRNAPTIKPNILPARGRTGRAPKIPERYQLAEAGLAFWKRAWKLPQATKWDDGAVDAVARRAQLEDYAAAVELVDTVDLEAIFMSSDDEELRQQLRNLEWALGKIRSLATGAVGLMKQMDALDDRLGLTPKSLAQLRWTIEEKPARKAAKAETDAEVARMADYRDRLGA